MTDPLALAPIAPPPRPACAVIHESGAKEALGLVEGFAHTLRERGFRVGGVVQRVQLGADGQMEGRELVDLASGRRFPISQNLGRLSQSCGLDTAGLADAGTAIRQAIVDGADLIVVNKFAGLEAQGEGLLDEMMAAIVAGIPVLTSVAGRHLAAWHQATGGVCQIALPEPRALWRWWGPHRLYEDLVLGVADTPVRRIVVGAKWVLVETTGGRVGLAARAHGNHGPEAPAPSPRQIDGEERGLTALAAGASRDWDPLGAAIGVAALNAHYNQAGLLAEALARPPVNGLDGGGGQEAGRNGGGRARVVVIGGFADIARRRPGAAVVEFRPQPGQYPETAADWLLAGADEAVITASSLVNRTLPRLLAAAEGAAVTLVGPGTPLSPRLFAYGVATLAGFVVEDGPRAAEILLAGGGTRALRGCGRMVTLEAGETNPEARRTA